MGLFSKILEKLGLKKEQKAGASATVPEKEKPAAQAPGRKVSTPAKPSPTPTSRTASRPKPVPVPVAAPKAPAPTPISEVVVVSKMSGLAARYPSIMNWKISLEIHLKLLEL